MGKYIIQKKGIVSIAIGFLIVLVVNIIPMESMLIENIDSGIPIDSNSPWKNAENGRSLWNSIKGL